MNGSQGVILDEDNIMLFDILLKVLPFAPCFHWLDDNSFSNQFPTFDLLSVPACIFLG